jgi:plastocyanin domain-containing protein
MKRFTLFTVITMTLLICLSGLAIAQEKKAEKKVDATLTMSEGQVAVGIGYSWGKGVLTYEGKQYPFKVSGLSVVDIGITKATSSGKVYNLKKLEDFNGNYTAASAEGTLAGGAGALTMKNQNGVVIDLVSTTRGVNLKLSVEGVKITLEK